MIYFLVIYCHVSLAPTYIFLWQKTLALRMVCLQKNQVISGIHCIRIMNTSAPNMSQTYHPPISTSDALPLSYRRLVVLQIIRMFPESCFVGCGSN